MKKLRVKLLACLAAVAAVAALLLPATAAQAGGVACYSNGIINEVAQYGSCSPTSANPGQVFFNDRGNGVLVTATGPSEAIAFWSSPGAIAVTPGQHVCLEWTVNYVLQAWPGAATQELLLSANGRMLIADTRIVHPGYQGGCFQLPDWATNVWWQLKTTASGGDNSTTIVSQSLTDVYGR